jgi:hypothetical protein
MGEVGNSILRRASWKRLLWKLEDNGATAAVF